MKTDAILTDKDEDLSAQGEEDRSEDVVEGVSPLVLALLETTQDGEFNPIGKICYFLDCFCFICT